jgi:hypothetical protein
MLDRIGDVPVETGMHSKSLRSADSGEGMLSDGRSISPLRSTWIQIHCRTTTKILTYRSAKMDQLRRRLRLK